MVDLCMVYEERPAKPVSICYEFSNMFRFRHSCYNWVISTYSTLVTDLFSLVYFQTWVLSVIGLFFTVYIVITRSTQTALTTFSLHPNFYTLKVLHFGLWLWRLYNWYPIHSKRPFPSYQANKKNISSEDEGRKYALVKRCFITYWHWHKKLLKDGAEVMTFVYSLKCA